MPQVNIYIATHKEYEFPQLEGHTPIHIGKALSAKNLGYLEDNTGDNISALNPYFCELTALYWMWKNSQSDILGLVHYRRYFISKKDGVYSYSSAFELASKIVENPKTIFIAKPANFNNFSIRALYFRAHTEIDWLRVKDIIADKYRDYLDAFTEFENSTSMSYLNMFVANKDFVNRYCEWLFGILFELHSRIDYSEYDAYQSRAVAFMAERLFNVFIHKHREELNIEYLQVYLLEEGTIHA